MNCRVSFLLAALLVAGCAFYGQWAEEPKTKTWPAAHVRALDVDLEDGAVTVTGRGDTAVTAVILRRCKGTVQKEAAYHLKDITVTDSTAGETLFLREHSPTPNYRYSAANIDISAPAATVLDISTSDGTVTLSDTRGSAQVTAANGAITATEHQGSLVAYAVNGAIRADFARLTREGNVSLHSQNGAVTLSLPAMASVAFVARSGNGTVQVEGFSNVHYTRDESGYKTGSIGAGSAKVDVSSDNGAVIIRAR